MWQRGAVRCGRMEVDADCETQTVRRGTGGGGSDGGEEVGGGSWGWG